MSGDQFKQEKYDICNESSFRKELSNTISCGVMKEKCQNVLANAPEKYSFS